MVDGSWVVGDPSGDKPSLQLSPDGFTSLSFDDPTLMQDACVVPVPEGSASGGAAVGSKPGSCPQASGSARCRTTRRLTALGALLTALGVDPEVVLAMSFHVNSDDVGGTYVSAQQMVDGQPTGASWNVSWVGDQVSSVYGAMAPLVSLGDYDVVSPIAAVQRLSDPRFGTMWGGGIVPMGVAIAADGMRNASSAVAVPPSASVSQPTWASSRDRPWARARARAADPPTERLRTRPHLRRSMPGTTSDGRSSR